MARHLLAIAWLLSPPSPQVSRLCYDAWMSTNVPALLSAVATIPPHELPPLEKPPAAPTAVRANGQQWPTSLTPASWSTGQKAAFECAFLRSKEKNHEHAAWLLSQLETSLVTAILRHIGINTHLLEMPEQLKYRSLVHLFSALSIPSMENLLISTHKPSSSRSFQVVTAACDLWNVCPRPKEELLGVPIHIVEPTATRFWKNLVQKYTISSSDTAFCAKSEDDLEAFYTTAFPQDIPDEWSLAERKKSHPQWTYAPTPNPWVTSLSAMLSQTLE